MDAFLSTGAIIGMFLILPALVAFVVDVLIKDNSASEAQQRRIKPTILFNTISRIFLILIIVVLLVPSISFVVISFTKSFPNDLSFTMEHLNYVIKRDIWAYFTNSIFISILTGILGTILVYFTAYLTTRVRGKFCKILHLISIFTLAIPGIVLGLGYIFLFKKSFIYGTFMIIIIANMVHFFSSPYLLAQNAMNKINREFETVGMTLGVSRLKTFIHVVIPCTLGTIFEMFIYYFVNSMVTISAVAFLYNIYTMPLSIMITQFESQIAYEAAAIVSLFILVTNIIAKTIVGIVQKVINKRMN